MIYQNILNILQTHFFGNPVSGSPEELGIILVAMFSTLIVFAIPFVCTWLLVRKILSIFGGL